jgi:hypothetical protein
LRPNDPQSKPAAANPRRSGRRLLHTHDAYVLIGAFTERRPTRDIDLQALRIPNDTESLNEVAVQIALIGHEDGIDFKTKSTTATVIRDQDEYSGIRVAMDASVHSANLRLKIDFSIGDPISPEPTPAQIESLMPGSRPITILSFPITMVLAEKVATATSRGTANTRWRDSADILAIVESNPTRLSPKRRRQRLT